MNKLKKMKTGTKIIICIITLLINIYCYFIFSNMYNAVYSPDFSKSDISPILEKGSPAEKDYSLLYSQTGLAKQAIDDLWMEKDRKNRILSFQDSYFSKKNLFIERLNPLTRQENLTVSGNMADNVFKIAPLRNGDILLTKSTHTLYWRHGHCGIVIDAKKGVTLESLEPGTLSMEQSISKWQSYSTFKLLRLKNADQNKLDQIAKYAAENLIDVKYDILASKNHNGKLKSENCSQLIWQAFIKFGYDIDSNKGIFVTPEDIAGSKLLEIVQIYGFDPEKTW